MSELKLALRDNRTAYRPGEEIQGAAGWKADQVPRLVEVRLFWRTEGKGTQDVDVVDTVTFDQPQMEEARPFRFGAPEAPYSFSGSLISVIWAVEIVLEPGHKAFRVDLTIGPQGHEVDLRSSSHEGA